MTFYIKYCTKIVSGTYQIVPDLLYDVSYYDILTVPVKKEKCKRANYEDKQYPHTKTPLISDSLIWS